jgi:hypothetical protein
MSMEIDSKYRQYPQTTDEFVTEANQLFENHGEYKIAYAVHGQDTIFFETFVSSPTEARKLEDNERPPDCLHQSPLMCLYLLWEVLLKMHQDGKTKIYWRMQPKIEKERHETHPYFGVMRVAFR